MITLLILLALLSLFILGIGIYMIYLTKETNMSKIMPFLDLVIYIIFSLLILSGLILIILAFFYKDTEFAILQLIEHGIKLLFFYFIFMQVRFLLSQLKKDIIFDRKNANALKEIAKLFIYLMSIEIITGLSFGIFDFLFVTHSFSLSITLMPFILMMVGFIFFITALIYDKAILVYEENQLTI